MPHLPQPARTRGVTITRVIRRAIKSPLPEVQTPEMKAATRDAASSEIEMLASPVEN